LRTPSTRTANTILFLALLTLLAQGLVRVMIVPLWAHYDEPSHYEYMRYIVENRRLPAQGQPDTAILERIADTYRRDTPIRPSCDTRGLEPCVAMGKQFDEMPGYYLLQAIIQIALNPGSIYQQVATAQIVSVLLSAAVGLIGWMTMQEAFPAQPLLAAGTPLLMSSLFGYVDLMSSLNNDVGAVAAVSLLVLASTLMLKHGLKWRTILLVLIAVTLCILAKSSGFIALPLSLFTISLTQWAKLPTQIKVGLVIGTALMAALAFTWVPQMGLLLRPALNDLLPVGGLNARLISWYNPQHWSHYGAALRWLFVTFWSGFGTGQPGLPQGAIVVLSGLSALAVIGIIRAWRESRVTSWQQQIVLFYVMTVAASLVVSILRIDPPGGYVPSTRHLYVSIIPTVFFILVGLGSWIPLQWRRYGMAGLIISLHILGLWSLVNVQIPWYVLNSP
jgi:hypothetical protein